MTAGSAGPERSRPGRVFVVIEDEPDHLMLHRLTLELAFEGCRVHLAADGASGLELLARIDEPDVVILDITMPRLDGWRTLERLRATGNGVPVIMCTALSSADDVARAHALGCDDFLSKPFTAGTLVARVAALLDRRR